MSLVYILKHNENIYSLGIEKTGRLLKAPKYISKYKEKKIPNAENRSGNPIILSSDPRAKNSHKTMGNAETILKSPCEFLKKNQGIKFLRTPSHKCGEYQSEPNDKYPPVPKLKDIQKPEERECKNFLELNIEQVKKSSPKRTIPKYVDTRRGDSHVLCKSGILPAYIFSPKFGKIPKYLLNAPKISKITKDEIAENLERERKVNQYKVLVPPGMILLNPNERMELLTGLKRNWYERQITFQSLPVCTDTQPKKVRKAKMEIELRQLEQDILLIENNPHIFICEENK